MPAVAPINTCTVFILGMAMSATSDRDSSTDAHLLQLQSDGSMKFSAYHNTSLKQAAELELEQEEQTIICLSWCVTCKKKVTFTTNSGVQKTDNYKFKVIRNQDKADKALWGMGALAAGAIIDTTAPYSESYY
mmetsp:Transcript_7896/g.8636  ORF Transcript_7896/g.8636 Transcript_7896/m.8636 type:complete len:133 (+) Transcript_7896:76-474(+)